MAHTTPRMLDHARGMRKEPTRSEARLWLWLRSRRFSGYKFRRQVPVGRYILDFYCAQLKLGIELYGAQHGMPGMLEYDDERSRWLRLKGIEVLRIPNELLIQDPQRVEEWVQLAIASRVR
jgi:very-short-patch-repair endonuclease